MIRLPLPISIKPAWGATTNELGLGGVVKKFFKEIQKENKGLKKEKNEFGNGSGRSNRERPKKFYTRFKGKLT